MKQILIFLWVVVVSCTVWSQGDVVCNPSFELGLSDWQNFANNGAIATFDTSSTAALDGAVGAVVDIQDVSSGTCVLSACVADMYANQTYRMTFWAKSEGEVEVLATISKASPGYTNFASLNVVLTEEWSQYEVSGSVTEDLPLDVRLAKFKFLSEGVVMIDDIQIEILELIPEVCQGNFENGLDTWAVNQNNGTISAELDGTDAAEGSLSAKLTVDNVEGGTPIFSSCPSYLPQATSLLIHFWAKSDTEGAVVEAKTALQAAPYTVYGEAEVTLSSTWQEYTFTAYSENEINGVRLAKFAFLTNGVHYIDHVWFEEVPPSPVVCNGAFEAALDSWVTSIAEDADATIAATPATSYDGVISAYAEVNFPGELPSSVQLASCRAGAVQDSIYALSIWVKGDEEGLAFNVSTAYADSPFAVLHSESFVTGSDWTEYCWQFTADSTVYDALRLVKVQFLESGTYHVDAASLQPLDHECASEVDWVSEEMSVQFTCHPNPVRGQLQVSVPHAWGTVQATMRSGAGQQVYVTWLQGEQSMDVQDLPSGMYFLTVRRHDGQRVTKRIQVFAP